MNELSMPERAAIIRGLVEGTSVRAIGRMTGHSKGAVLRLLVEVGEFCEVYQDHALRKLPCKRVEADEVWGYCGAKEKNKTKDGQGDLRTFTAICADSKLILSWLVGNRDRDTAHEFMQDVASRLRNRVQLTTDGHSMYLSAVESAFGWNDCDFAQLVKKYGTESGVSDRYGTPEVCIGADKVAVFGSPDMKNVTTSYVERANLSIRMGMRRMTRASNGFSKKAENHAHAFAIHMMHYNYCRPHQTLTKAAKGIKTTPAMAAGLTDHAWTLEEVLGLMDPTRLLH